MVALPIDMPPHIPEENDNELMSRIVAELEYYDAAYPNIHICIGLDLEDLDIVIIDAPTAIVIHDKICNCLDNSNAHFDIPVTALNGEKITNGDVLRAMNNNLEYRNWSIDNECDHNCLELVDTTEGNYTLFFGS